MILDRPLREHHPSLTFWDTHAHIHPCMHTYIHVCTHTPTHTQTCTHTDTCMAPAQIGDHGQAGAKNQDYKKNIAGIQRSTYVFSPTLKY